MIYVFVILTFFYFDTSRCFASAGINLEVENICWYKLYDLCFCYINIFIHTSRCFASAGINLEVENICYYKIYVSTIYMIYVFVISTFFIKHMLV